MKVRVDTISSHLTRDRAYRNIPVGDLVRKIQQMNAVVKGGSKNPYIQVGNYRVVIRPKQNVCGVTHVDIVTAWSTAA